MLTYDDTYHWKGWGGRMKLGSGRCKLRIFDLSKGSAKGVAHLRPIIVVVSDIPGGRMTIRSCAGHIATNVTKDFSIKPNRMVWIEHYPEKIYGIHGKHLIPEKFETVDFVWHEDKAIKPKWRPLNPNMRDIVKEQMEENI